LLFPFLPRRNYLLYRISVVIRIIPQVRQPQHVLQLPPDEQPVEKEEGRVGKPPKSIDEYILAVAFRPRRDPVDQNHVHRVVNENVEADQREPNSELVLLLLVVVHVLLILVPDDELVEDIDYAEE